MAGRHTTGALPGIVRGTVAGTAGCRPVSLLSAVPTTSTTFGVLGAVVVGTPAGAVRIAQPRQRAVLATLLLDVGRTVPLHRLQALVWEADQPPSARKAIQVYVAQLRQALRGLPGTEVSTENDGYRLVCRRDAVDLHQFRDLVTRARQQASPAVRRMLLARAVELWRGPAFLNTGASGLRERVTPVLDEERLAAIEDLYEAELADGPSSGVVGPLMALVSDHPLRERPVALLMTALQRCGRGHDAAAVYLAARQALPERAGPGTEPDAVHAAP
jgi:DNA-binding SARP family transcriptional activator